MSGRNLDSYFSARFGDVGDDDDFDEDSDDDAVEDEFEASFADFGPPPGVRLSSSQPPLSSPTRQSPRVAMTAAHRGPMTVSAAGTPPRPIHTPTKQTSSHLKSPMTPSSSSFSADANSPTMATESQLKRGLGSTGTLNTGDSIGRSSTLRKAGVTTIATLARLKDKLRPSKRSSGEPVYATFQPAPPASGESMPALTPNVLNSYAKWSQNRRMVPQRQTFYETVGSTVNHNIFEFKFVSNKDEFSAPHFLEVCSNSFVIRSMDTGAFLREYPYHLIKTIYYSPAINGTSKSKRYLIIEYLKAEPAMDTKISTARIAITSEDRDAIMNEIRQAMVAHVKRTRA